MKLIILIKHKQFQLKKNSLKKFKKPMKMGLSIMVKKKMEKDTDTANSIMQMEDYMKENGFLEEWKGLGHFIILREDQLIMETGKMINSMAKEQFIMKIQFKLDLMDLTIRILMIYLNFGLNMKDNSLMIIRKDQVLYF